MKKGKDLNKRLIEIRQLRLNNNIEILRTLIDGYLAPDFMEALNSVTRRIARDKPMKDRF